MLTYFGSNYRKKNKYFTAYHANRRQRREE